jgi:UDP-2-acetamido-3-amino-2,3-dideoxy-glucuronate N-acetyltransferase
MADYFIHASSFADEGCSIGKGTRIWHFCHIMKGAIIGENCAIGQNVNIGSKAIVGNGVKIQNNVSIYDDVIIEDDVFCGPSCVFTNVFNPRAFIERKHEYKKTIVKKGTSIGANATIVCGVTLGEYCFIGAGSVVTKDVPSYGLVYGNPSSVQGWICECGEKLNENLSCSVCEKNYMKTDFGLLRNNNSNINYEK